MKWYKTLNVHQRINAKDCFILLCGVDFQAINCILSLRDRINLLEEKLKLEGFYI